VPKFSLLWLFLLTTILAVLFGVAAQSLPYAYLLSCITLACFAGLVSRFLFVKSHATSLTIAAITSIAVGGLLLAIGSCYTPIGTGTGNIVGNQSRPFALTFFVGAILGYCFCILPLLMYALVIGWRALAEK
jgi:hypothetical protein